MSFLQRYMEPYDSHLETGVFAIWFSSLAMGHSVSVRNMRKERTFVGENF